MLNEQVAIISGSTRGIGREIALTLAQQGVHIVILGKTVSKHEYLPGTIHSVAKEISAYGVDALPIEVDVRDQEQIDEMVQKVIKRFGRIDICVNNASALNLKTIEDISAKEWDLIQSVNARGTFLLTKACLPFLLKREYANVLTISPPISLDPAWFGEHLAYTISKYNMSMCTLGLSERLKNTNVRVNSLWPKTLIATSAVKYNLPKEYYAAARSPKIMADAALVIINKLKDTGNFYIDEEVLLENGEQDLSKYLISKDVPPLPDLFI